MTLKKGELPKENLFNPDEMRIYKGVFTNTPNGVIVTNTSFFIEYMNDAAENLTGIHREVVEGNYFYDVFPQIDIIELVENDGFSVRKTINGSDIHIRKFDIKDEEGYVKAIVFMMQDFTEPLKLSTQLEKSQHVVEELRDILEGSFDGVLVTDGEGNVLMVNKSYERITGIKTEELLGKNMQELINPVWMKTSVALIIMKEKQPVSLHHTTKHGKNIIVTGVPIFDERKKIKKIIINARDISEIYELREELLKAREMEKIYFRQMSTEAKVPSDFGKVVVVSKLLQDVYALAGKVSNVNTTVLITGESGVGKEEVAKFIHTKGFKKDKPFVTINCGAIPANLLESELFGYAKGAFTGASKDGKAGIFEAASGGTLLLDEIGEMPMELQVKLLRVLESREVTRVGAVKPIPIDVRIIAATNQILEKKVEIHEFREDLYYRLNVVQIKIPSLRERKEDIAPLCLSFMKRFNSQYGQNKKMTYEVIREFENHNWPGNIRQLKNVIENLVIVSNNEYLQINDIPWMTKEEAETGKQSGGRVSVFGIMPLNEAYEKVEKDILSNAKERYGSSRKIAKALGVDQSTIVRKMKKYEV